MALTSALVDQGRILRKAAEAQRIEGRTVFTEVETPWFRCRLDLRTTQEAPEPSSGVRRTVKTPVLLTGVIDVDGNLLDIKATDRLEVVSNELGSAYWQVQGDPTPMRKKRRVIGYEVQLQRIEEHPFTPNVVPVP